MTAERLQRINDRYDQLNKEGYTYEDAADWAMDAVADLLDEVERLQSLLKGGSHE